VPSYKEDLQKWGSFLLGKSSKMYRMSIECNSCEARKKGLCSVYIDDAVRLAGPAGHVDLSWSAFSEQGKPEDTLDRTDLIVQRAAGFLGIINCGLSEEDRLAKVREEIERRAAQ
jgi:hypothetical protein